MTTIAPQDIRALRQRLGLSREGMASLVPCHRSSIYDWERGTKNPTGLYLRRLRQLMEEHPPSAEPDIDHLVNQVRAALHDGLRAEAYAGDSNPYLGHSAHAVEALWHLLGKGATPTVITMDGLPHWFLVRGDRIIDPCPEEVTGPIPYEHGRGTGMLRSQPSKKAQAIIDRVKEQQS